VDTLIEKINRVYDRLERDDSNGVSRYNSDAMNDEVLFALVYSYVTGDPTDTARNNRSLTENDLNAWDNVTFDEVRQYANDEYGYKVCARCDSDICQHVNN
jgi:hypothetical protein